MDTSNFIHVVITVIGIIGAGAVALVCDMLKTNNERLREANLELQIRREAEQRRADQALEHLKRIAPLAGERSIRGGPPRSLPALAHSLAAAEQAGSTMPEARLLAREFLENLSARAAGEERVPGGAQRVGAAVAEAPESEPAPVSRGPRKNWELLLKGGAHRTTIDVTPVPGGARQRGELIPFESLQTGYSQPEADKFQLPSGFHGMWELSRLLDMTKPLTGLVVSIGLSGTGSSESGTGIPAGTVRGAAAEWVRGMLAPGEFGCQSGIDQFLIVTSGAPEGLQNRLGEMAGKLWDYQLRDDVMSTVTLSWGSHVASGEALPDAIRSAMHRMEENRRSRVSGQGAGASRRRAV